MADLTLTRDADMREHDLIATTIAEALDCVYLRHGLDAKRDFGSIKPLTSSPDRPAKYLLPTLPQALGLCPDDEKISLTCMANMSARTFWEFVVEKLELENTSVPRSDTATLMIQAEKVNALRRLDLSRLSTARIVFNYCTKPENFGSQSDFDLRSELVPPAIVEDDNLAKLLDQQVFANELAPKLTALEEDDRELCIQTFYSGYDWLLQWALARGILSAELKMLDSGSLSAIYLSYVCQKPTDLNVSATDFLRSFFVWFNDLFDCQSTQDEVVLEIKGGWDWTAHLGPDSVRAIRRETGRVLDLYTANPAVRLDHSIDDGLGDFSKMFGLYVKVDIRCWNAKHRSAFYDSIPQVLLALQTKIRKTGVVSRDVRIWPYPLTLESEGDDGGKYYLIGIESDEERNTPSQKDLLDRTASDLVGSLKYDRKSALITHEVLSAEDLLTLLPSLSHEIPMRKRAFESHLSPSKSSSAKFRTAAATLNRLRWDPNHASVEYEIGYVDRFEDDLMWKPLENWERHTEDEDFVPEHRIRKIRRKADQVLVWDREARWDGTGEG